MNKPSFAEMTVASLIEALADAVAAIVIARLQGLPGLGVPKYATAKENPLGGRRNFLDACRDGAFPSFKRGRVVHAEWADAERYAKSRPSRRWTAKDRAEASLDALYEQSCRPVTRRAKKEALEATLDEQLAQASIVRTRAKKKAL